MGLWPVAYFITLTNRGVSPIALDFTLSGGQASSQHDRPPSSLLSDSPSLLLIYFSPLSLPVCVSLSWFLLITICGRWNKGGVFFFFMWLAWSQCCHCNVCLPIALWEKNGVHLPLLFLQLQCINSITLATRLPPFFSLSLFNRNPSTFPFFFPFSDAVTLSIHFISLQFSAPFLLLFACRSSRCHQVFCRQGWGWGVEGVEAGQGGRRQKRFQKEANSVRRSLMTRQRSQMYMQCTWWSRVI